MSTDLYFEASESSISDKLIRQLARSSEDLTRSLESFTSQRAVAVEAQKLALVAYEEEMRRIEGGRGDEYYEEPAITVDHNVLRHLNIDRNSDKYQEYQNVSLATIINDVNEEQGKPNLEMKYPVDLSEKPPMPSVEEKKNIREAMFDFLDESRMEEMRLELELEQARSNGDKKVAEELAEALYLVQKVNGDKLRKILVDYQPAGLSKNWGNDSDYNNMLRNLHDVTSGGPRNSSKKVDLFAKNKKKRRSKKRDQEEQQEEDENYEEDV